MSIDRWLDKEKMVYIYNGILLTDKKEWNNVIYSNLDATRDYHTKWSKSERERKISYDITYMLNLNYDTIECYLQNGNKLTDTENRCMVAKGIGRGEERDWELLIGRCKLLHLEWMKNKILMCSTGNYIQYPMINH